MDLKKQQIIEKEQLRKVAIITFSIIAFIFLAESIWGVGEEIGYRLAK